MKIEVIFFVLALEYFNFIICFEEMKSHNASNFSFLGQNIIFPNVEGILNEQFCKCFLGVSSECITSLVLSKQKQRLEQN